MNKIELALISAIEKHPEMPLVIAYSGGVDSQVLLYALASIRQKSTISNPLTVCHVNHGLSKNANDWQLFAEETCEKLNLALEVVEVNINVKTQQSLEAQAREARYMALQSIYNRPSLIITGHHSDDQAETFLLALKRGSGLKGLSAMSTETNFGDDILLRPLLDTPRTEVVNYARNLSLSWIEDESNADTQFDRNFLRNDIIPLLINRWPSLVKTINRSSDHCREGQLLLNELATEDLKKCQYQQNSLLIEELTKLSQNRFNNVIRYYLEQNRCLMPSSQQLAQLFQQLNAGDDKNPEVKVGDNYLRRYKEALYLTAEYADIRQWFTNVTLCETENYIDLPDNLGKLSILKTEFSENLKSKQQIALPNEATEITIRFGHNNPTCLPDYRNHSRSLKKVLQELNIPTWQRKRIPFLYFDDVLVAAIGFFVCQEFSPKTYLPNNSLPQREKVEPCLTINWAQ